MGASVLTAAALLFTWGRDATWINSNERRKQPLNAVLEIVPIIVPPRKNLSVSTTGILNRDKQGEEILSHVFPVCQLGVSNVSASFLPRLQESVTQDIECRLSQCMQHATWRSMEFHPASPPKIKVDHSTFNFLSLLPLPPPPCKISSPRSPLGRPDTQANFVHTDEHCSRYMRFPRQMNFESSS